MADLMQNMRPAPGAAAFTREVFTIAGIETVVHSLGSGPPLVFLHGAGTLSGFAWTASWAAGHRVIFPHHPGYGESADDTALDCMDDYLLHYLALFDAMGLGQIDLVGHSMGGWMAAEFALRHPERVRRLVLVSPAGLDAPGVARPDIFTIADDLLPGYLVHDFHALLPFLPSGPDVDFLTMMYREKTSTARAFWLRFTNPKLPRWLHRASMPCLLIWGAEDRLLPPALAPHWAALLPDARIILVPETGHLVFEENAGARDWVADFLR